MTKWIENIESPVVWAVMEEVDGTLEMCRAGSHPMIYVSQAMARAQMRRLKNKAGGDLPLKIVRYTADSEILNWRD
ncbi:hypothetical protein [Lactobacillus delbrueckii]|uniref:hypothetical protein n=1 Tax=Lactobacillus delbrueckii TaxID=1584 RepID=UPI001E3521D0|nr:hypothetical protein [Lactobacillus delbrueckii]MCD5445114.1 hypothetical protein [Lactobacillus delbrueckii subsp. lactis]